MSSATIYTSGVFIGFDNNGKPLSYGTVEFTNHNTGEIIYTYSNAERTEVNENPVTLSSVGKANIFLDDNDYDIVMRDQYGTIVETLRNFSPSGGGGLGGGGYQGEYTPEIGAEYPEDDPNNYGSFWSLAIPWTFQTGDLAGEVGQMNDLVMWSVNGWTLLELGFNLEIFLRVDGQNAMKANLDAGYHKVTNLNDGEDERDAVNVKQVAKQLEDIWRQEEFIDESSGQADANKPIKTDSQGLLDDSFLELDNIWRQEEFIDVSSGQADANKPIKTDSQGLLDDSFLELDNIWRQEEFIDESSGQEDAGLPIVLNSQGVISETMLDIDFADIYTKDEFIDESLGSESANAPVKTDSQGNIDSSFIEFTSLRYRGVHQPEVIAYPNPGDLKSGDYYVIDLIDGTTEYTWTAGDLIGRTATQHDIMIFTQVAPNWSLVEARLDPTAYVMIDGSTTMQGSLAMGGHKVVGMLPGVNAGDAVTIEQMNDAIGDIDYDGIMYANGSVPMTGNLDLNTNKIENLSPGVNSSDAVNLLQMNNAIGDVDLTGVIFSDGSVPMEGNLDLGTSKIINLGRGVNPGDGVNVLQFSDAILRDGSVSMINSLSFDESGKIENLLDGILFGDSVNVRQLTALQNNTYDKTAFIDVTEGIADANKPVKTNTSGKIDTSLLELSGLNYRGGHNPMTDGEYPTPTVLEAGDFYTINLSDGTTEYTWATGVLSGQTATVNDAMMYSESDPIWNLIEIDLDPTAYINKNGSVAMEADLPMGANNFSNLRDAVLAQEAVTLSQLDGALGGIDFTDFIKKDGTVQMDAPLRMGSNVIAEVAPGVAQTDAVNLSQVQDLVGDVDTTEFLKLDGSRAMTNQLVMGNNQIIQALPGTEITHATTLGQVQDLISAINDFLKLDGSTEMNAILNMGNNQISGLVAGVNALHAVNKSQLDESFDNYWDKDDFISQSQGNLSANLPIMTDSQGNLDSSFLELTGFNYRGNHNPVTTEEYPNPGDLAPGDFYNITLPDETNEYTWTTGDLINQTATVGDVMVFSANSPEWNLIEMNLDPTAYINKDGSVAMEGNLSLGGNKITQLGDASLGSKEAVPLSQLDAGWINRDGTRGMLGNFSAGGYKIVNMEDGTIANNGATLGQVQEGFLDVDGNNRMKANMNMGNNRITNLSPGQIGNDAVPLGQVQEGFLDVDGNNAMKANLSMGNSRITNLSPGQIDNDAVTLGQVQSLMQVPVGVIVMWSGVITEIPDNWALCNGLNNTPDMTDRFVLGTVQQAQIGDVGGDNTATMPAHSHGLIGHTHAGASHTHTTPNHTHTASAQDGGTHSHPYVDTVFSLIGSGLGGTNGALVGENKNTSSAGAHGHIVTVNSGGAGTTDAGGTEATGTGGEGATESSGGTGSNMPSFLKLAFIMKV